MTIPGPLLSLLRRPDAAPAFSLSDWDIVVRHARRAGLLATLHALLDEEQLLSEIPERPREHLYWASLAAERHAHAARQEIRLIAQALSGVGVPLILLKGAAYLAAALPPARGRLFSDVDILVPKASLGAVEAALMQHGWVSLHADPYDQRYYRKWMHELPPMQHLRRGTSIDVHHAILPETAAIRPDPERLRAAARAAGEWTDLLVLSPSDMVLHSAVHLIHGSEFDNGLRDLFDIRQLLMHFGGVPGFWRELAERAVELGLQRPLFYALRYAACLLGLQVPGAALLALDAAGPHALQRRLMDALFLRTLVADHPSVADAWTPLARYLLYVRGNWLRMPGPLLARHLFHKAFISPRTEGA